jgi:Carboxypeptidase regulatory-like domain
MRASKIAVLLLLAATLLLAQARVLDGTVRDQDGHPLVGAVVQMRDLNSLNIRSSITQKDGRYHFGGVSTNTSYRLQAKYRDYSSHVRHLSQFDGRKSAVIDLTVDLDRWSKHR